MSYWQYGFGFYLEFADVYYHFTNGECDLRHSEKVDKIAQYLQKMIMRKNVAVSFSDSSRTYNISHIGLISYLINNYDGIDIPIFRSDLSEFLKSNG